MYVLKQLPEDFIVREISSIKCGQTGSYVYFRLSKRNYNTLDAVQAVGRAIGVDQQEIGFAGSKDYNAITEQFCSVKAKFAPRLRKVDITGITIEVLGYGNSPISLGDLVGNEFEIVIRKLLQGKIKEKFTMINYFDEQRFSINNVEVGSLLVRKDFTGAARLLDDAKCRQYLKNNPTDGVGALRLVPKRLLRLYVNAFQSALWNEAVGLYLKKSEMVLHTKYDSEHYCYSKHYSQGELYFFDSLELWKDLSLPLPGFMWDTCSKPQLYQEIMENLFVQRGGRSAMCSCTSWKCSRWNIFY